MRKKKVNLSTIAVVLVFILGVGLLLYPTVSDRWNSFHQTRAINSYTDQVAELDPAACEKMLADAHAYNEELANKENPFADASDDSHARYEALLNLTGDGIMGYIEIGKINVRLPVCHTVGEDVLQKAVGHLEGSSLPVGGESTHAVLSGHRGLPSARLFTDLASLEEGDTFVLSVLDQTMTYEIDQIRIVLPDETSDLNIVPGEDLCTLVTCTPYGINSHRMLVRGRRVENAKAVVKVTADGARVAPVVVAPFIGIPLLIILLAFLLRPKRY